MDDTFFSRITIFCHPPVYWHINSIRCDTNACNNSFHHRIIASHRSAAKKNRIKIPKSKFETTSIHHRNKIETTNVIVGIVVHCRLAISSKRCCCCSCCCCCYAADPLRIEAKFYDVAHLSSRCINLALIGPPFIILGVAEIVSHKFNAIVMVVRSTQTHKFGSSAIGKIMNIIPSASLSQMH